MTISSQADTKFPHADRATKHSIFIVVCFAVPLIAYFWLVDAYSVNTIWVDQWSDLGLIRQAYSGHLTLTALWAQHTDNRILFPNLVVLLLAKVTHFNTVDEAFLSAITLVLAISVLIIGHRRRAPKAPWMFYLPMAIVMLSFAQSDNTLWGFQFAWYFVLLTLCIALVLCDGPRWGWLITGGAIAAAVVGSYSSLQGLLIWPAALSVLLLRRRPMAFILTWITAGAVTTAVYFVNYNRQRAGSNVGYALHHPFQGLRFFVFSVGNVIGVHGGNLPLVLGVLIIFTAFWLTFLAVFRPVENDGSPLGVGLICFGLLFAAIITAGRATAGLDAGGGSRYTTFAWLTLVGCYLIVLSRRTAPVRDDRMDEAFWYGSVITVGVAVFLTLVLGTVNGLNDADSWQHSQIQASRLIANIQKAPDSMVERVLTVNPYDLQETRYLAAFARSNRLSLFESPSTVDQYVRAGLPYTASSLMTTVISPQSGTVVKGGVALVATAQSDFGVTSVDFDIDGATGTPVRLHAAKTLYGWIAEWNSTRQSDGQYKIESVAYDHAHHRAQGEAAVVRVDN